MDFEDIDYNMMDEDDLYEYGCDLLNDGDVESAVKCFKLAAEKGCSDAMLQLAEMYDIGDDVEADFEESIKWYKLAAESGDLEAQRYLAEDICYDFAEESLEWCMKVAEYGNSDAQLYLAEMYRYGNGVEKDLEESLKWYKLAAEGGNRDAIYNLGHMYYYGDGVEQDYKQAYYWFDKDGFRDLPYYICADMYFYVDKNYENAFRLYHEALNQGVEEAAYKIGEMYYYGLGTKQDYSKAFEFLKYYNDEFDERVMDFAPSKVHYMLAEMYNNGWGVEQNLKEAEKLFRAAEKGQDC